MRKSLLLLVAPLLIPTLALADSTASTTATTSADPYACFNTTPTTSSSVMTIPLRTYDFCGFTVSGYLDGSYNYLSHSNTFINGVPDRLFDNKENGFSLQQIGITIAKQPTQGFGGLVTLIGGRDANIMASYGMLPTPDHKDFGGTLSQGFLQYAAGPVTVMGGKYTTLAGYETGFPIYNTNFSRGILAGYAQPGTLMGVRGTYVMNSAVSLMGGVNNGWDSIRDTGRNKTVELGINSTITPKFTLLVDGLVAGQERADGIYTSTGPQGTRNLIDLVATYNLTDNLTIAGNYDYLRQSEVALPTSDGDGTYGNGSVQGLAGYINYKFDSKWRTSLRGEVFDDSDGMATGIRQNWRELTLTVGYALLKNMEVRAETRHDFSNKDSILNESDGETASNNQQSYALEMVYLM